MKQGVQKTGKEFWRMFLIVLQVGLSFMAVQGQSDVALKIRILDAWSHEPVPGVGIYGKQDTLHSDLNGLVNIPQELLQNNLFLKKTGYAPQEIIVRPSEKVLTLFLEPVWQIDTVFVIGRRPLWAEFEITSGRSRISLFEEEMGQDLGQTLSGVNGVFLKDYGGEEGIQSLSIRGLGSEHTLVLMDGIPLNHPQLGSVNLANYRPESFSEVEVYRGGNSTLFGSGAVGGVVNLLSDFPRNFQLSFATEYGAYGQQDFLADLTIPLNRWVHDFQYSVSYGANAYEFLLNGQKARRKNSDFRKWQMNYRLNFSPSPKDAFLWHVFSNTSTHGAPNAMTDIFSYQGRARLSDEQLLGRFRWDHEFSRKDQLRVQIYTRRDWMDYENPDLMINNKPLRSHHFDQELGFMARHRRQFSPAIRVFGGVEGSLSKVKSSNVAVHQRRRFAFYELAEWIFWNQENAWASLQFAARGEYYSDLEEVFLPRSGLNIKFNDFQFYLSLGKNFRAPTFNDLYWQPGGNPDLKPEWSISYEAGMIYHWRRLGNWHMALNAYAIHLKDMIRWMPVNGSLWQPRNLDRVYSRGIEAEVQFSLPERTLEGVLQFKNGISTKEASNLTQDQTIGNRLPFLPSVEALVRLKTRVQSLTLGGEFQYMNFRYTTFANQPDEILPAVSLLRIFGHIDLRWRKLGFRIYGRVDNLLRREIQLVNGYPLPLQNWRVGIRVGVYPAIKSLVL